MDKEHEFIQNQHLEKALNGAQLEVERLEKSMSQMRRFYIIKIEKLEKENDELRKRLRDNAKSDNQ
jgi:hypothetical protein